MPRRSPWRGVCSSLSNCLTSPPQRDALHQIDSRGPRRPRNGRRSWPAWPSGYLRLATWKAASILSQARRSWALGSQRSGCRRGRSKQLPRLQPRFGGMRWRSVGNPGASLGCLGAATSTCAQRLGVGTCARFCGTHSSYCKGRSDEVLRSPRSRSLMGKEPARLRRQTTKPRRARRPSPRSPVPR
jgi:hypothetical protein